MLELKTCPFCGGKAKLKKSNDYTTTTGTTIRDFWWVVCENNCCTTPKSRDEIYHADDGEIVVARNGAKEVADAWNKRAGDSE